MSAVEHASSADVAPVKEGDILDGKYRVERVLGVGGMGVVVAATHLQLGQRVALKFLLPTVLGNAEVVARFAREARAAVRIQSEHVARVIDVGTLTTGSPYMVMEYLEGGDLAASLQTRGPLPVVEAVTYVLEACEAIAEAHAIGVVHRDLKPANLFLARRTGRDPMVKVLDFGISKTTDPAVSGLTQTTAVMGSPLYMSPEQMMSSKDVDARTDIWSIGVILYELLVGEPPFVGETMAQVVFMVTNRDPPLLIEKRSDAPQGLAEIVRRCLRRTPAERFANVAELASALVPFGSPRADVSLERISRVLGVAAAAAPRPRVDPTPASIETSASPPTDLLSPPPKRKVPLLLAAVITLVLLLGGVLLWRSLHSSAEPVATPNVVVPAPPTPIAPAVAPIVQAAPPEPTPVAAAPSAQAPASAAAVAPSAGPQAVVVAPPPSAAAARTPSARHAHPRDIARSLPSPVVPAPTTNSSPLHMEMK